MALEAESALSIDPFGDDIDQGNPDDNGGQSADNQPTDGNKNDEGGGNSEDSDLINSLLTHNGITDSSKIKFVDENDNTVERSWKDLTKEEKFNVLLAQPSAGTSELNQEELDFIKQLRDSGQTPTAYLDSLKQQAIESVSQNPIYEIDEFSDDQLFVLDALDRYGEENVTDEQLDTLLQNAKSDPELYAKTISTLREQYKQREDDLKLRTQEMTEKQREDEFNTFGESILQEIQSLKEVGGQEIELTIDDMNELANYILTRDENGNSEFGLAMQDPKLFTQMAFWALKGKDIMNEISAQTKRAYEKGLEAGKSGKSQLAIKPSNRDNQPQHSAGLTADALDVE